MKHRAGIQVQAAGLSIRHLASLDLAILCLAILHLVFAGPLFAQAASFAAVRVDAAGPQDPWVKVAGDLDGDGLSDIIVGGRSGPLVWYSSPRWAKHRIADGGWSTVGGAAADVDGDRDLDLVLGGTVWFENPGHLESAPEGAWKLHRIGDDPTHDALVGDLDGDKRLDVVTRNQSEFGAKAGNKVRVWLQRPGDAWRGEAIECAHGEGLALGDLDRDGDPDIVLGGAWIETVREGGSVRWQAHRFGDFHPNATVALADLNGDGRLDVALAPSELAGQKHRMSWFEAPKDPREGPWREHVIVGEIEAVVHSLAAADIDLDGRADIVFAEMHQGADPDEVGVLYNGGGGGSWRKEVLSRTGSHGVQVLDFDGDGDMDIFGANWSGPFQPVELWVNPARAKSPGR